MRTCEYCEAWVTGSKPKPLIRDIGDYTTRLCIFCARLSESERELAADYIKNASSFIENLRYDVTARAESETCVVEFA